MTVIRCIIIVIDERKAKVGKRLSRAKVGFDRKQRGGRQCQQADEEVIRFHDSVVRVLVKTANVTVP